MLAITQSLPLQHFVSDIRKIASRVTLRMMIASAAAFAVLSAGIAMAAFASAAPSCAAGQSLLVYSRYDRKGIATAHQYRCGEPHATCALRAAPLGNAPTYDCSAFVLPKGTVKW